MHGNFIPAPLPPRLAWQRSSLAGGRRAGAAMEAGQVSAWWASARRLWSWGTGFPCASSAPWQRLLEVPGLGRSSHPSPVPPSQAKQEACVRAAVGLRRAAGSGLQESFRVVNEDSSRLIFVDKADKGIQEGCFTFDGVFSLDTGQDQVFSELVRPLLAMVPLGYSVSLLLWEAPGAGTKPQGAGQHHSIIQQEPEPPGPGGERLRTVSLVQLCADGRARDLLCPRNQALPVLDVPPLGLMVQEASEIRVSSSAAASSIYAKGLAGPALPQGCSQQSQAEQQAAACASLFTLTLEQDLEGCQRRRSAVRIVEFPRGAGPCVEPLAPLRRALAPGELPDDAGSLPWVLKRTLEGNNLTFLLLCLALPDASGEEILAALSLAEQARGLAKTVSATHWDPAEAAGRQRAAIRELRAQLLASRHHATQQSLARQLGRALGELQVLKSQSWEKKKAMAEACEGSSSQPPEAQGRIPLQLGRDEPLTDHVLTDMLRSQEVPDRGIPKPDGDIPGVGPLCSDQSSPGRFDGLSASEGAAPGGKPLQRGGSRTQEPSCTAGVAGAAGSWALAPRPTMEQQFAAAKARRQRLQEQHQRLIQQEALRLEEQAGSQEDAPRWPQERALLALQLEARRREQAEAEKDLEALWQQQRWEAETHKHHVLQVFRAYRGLWEEQTEARERRYRKLLQETLQDAISLSAQNQQLRAQRQPGSTERAVQTEPGGRAGP
ncbi:uncharacterized protein LOC142818695 isoform X2 [Pelodiscus sinensis]|uniref:uncharacterized protein LOC142818695 isoform X2 n=1 Tax=Pelodiscus sinensis TaxID=13735 RepID=UPI003F6C55FE